MKKKPRQQKVETPVFLFDLSFGAAYDKASVQCTIASKNPQEFWVWTTFSEYPFKWLKMNVEINKPYSKHT